MTQDVKCPECGSPNAVFKEKARAWECADYESRFSIEATPGVWTNGLPSPNTYSSATATTTTANWWIASSAIPKSVVIRSGSITRKSAPGTTGAGKSLAASSRAISPWRSCPSIRARPRRVPQRNRDRLAPFRQDSPAAGRTALASRRARYHHASAIRQRLQAGYETLNPAQLKREITGR